MKHDSLPGTGATTTLLKTGPDHIRTRDRLQLCDGIERHVEFGPEQGVVISVMRHTRRVRAGSSNSDVESHSRRVRCTPNNGRRQTGPFGPFRATNGHSAWLCSRSSTTERVLTPRRRIECWITISGHCLQFKATRTDASHETFTMVTAHEPSLKLALPTFALQLDLWASRKGRSTKTRLLL
jgi:hypothetical protein